MIPNITRGGNVLGVLSYLLGKGRREEHEHPRLVAGSASVVATHGDLEISSRDAGELARFLDAPRLMSAERVSIAERDADGRRAGSREGHVWHCSLSLHPDGPDLGDERWRKLADAFVEKMGFEPEQRGGCRWLAVHHGRSGVAPITFTWWFSSCARTGLPPTCSAIASARRTPAASLSSASG